MRKALIYLVVVIVVFAGLIAIFAEWQCARHDLENRQLDQQARREAGGSFISLPEGITHYELAGPSDGRLVVLVHGFSVPYFLWNHTFQPLVAAGFRVLRYDAFGRGYSDRPEVKYDAKLFVSQLSDLLSALHVNGPVDLVASSLGGPVVVAFAAQHPEQVRSITLFDPGYFEGEPMPWRIMTPYFGEYVMCTRIAPHMTASQKEDFVHPEKFPDYFERYAAQIKFKGTRAALLSTLREFVGRDDREDYRKLGLSGKPVLLVWGKKDKDVPFETSRLILAAVPQAEFHALDNAAHVGFYEEPDTVNPLVIDFLRKH